MATSLDSLGNIYWARGEYERANEIYERSFAIFEEAFEPDHPKLADGLDNLAAYALMTAAHPEAIAAYERSLAMGAAIAIDEKSLGPDHPTVGYPLAGLADTALAERRPADAVPVAQRAITLWEAHEGHPTDLAHVRFTLARASWDAPEGEGRDRTRARARAERAREGLAAAGKAGSAELVKVER